MPGMPARNTHHDAVVEALRADGWVVTHDPLGMAVGPRRLYVDLGADRSALGAERNGERIAVEVQSFLSKSPLEDLHMAVGQYVVYRAVLRRRDPRRVLHLAVPQSVYNGIFSEPLGRLVMTDVGLNVVVFHPRQRRIVRWTS
jgi:hypothetical protein